MMNTPNFLSAKFHIMRTVFCIVSLAMSLPACQKTQGNDEPAATAEPKVQGGSVIFSAQSPVAKRLITVPVEAPQSQAVNVPGRLVWDEDHTIRIQPPVQGRLAEALAAGALGANVDANETLAYLMSPELGALQAEYVNAQANLLQADKNFSRVKDMLAINGASSKDLEQAKADLEHARTDVERTSLRLKSLGASNTIDQRFAVRSSIAGVVVERNINPGMEWRPDQVTAPLFVVSDPSYLWCWLDASEQMLASLHKDMQITLHSGAWPQSAFPAQIDYIGDALDPVSHTIKVRARLRNPDRQLKGEMLVIADIASHSEGSLAVPAKAVFLNNNQQQVFVKTSEGQFTRKTIVPLTADSQWITISHGLTVGEQVVVDGALYLEKIMEDAAATPAEQATADARINKQPPSSSTL